MHILRHMQQNKFLLVIEMQEISEDVQMEMKKLEEELDAVFRGMCRRSPIILISGDLKAAM